MDEATWLTSAQLDQLLVILQGMASDRKLRLFCCACVRRVWYQLVHSEESRGAVELAEKFADGQKTQEELVASLFEAERAIRATSNSKERDAIQAAAWCVCEKVDTLSITRSVAWAAAYASQDTSDAERNAQTRLLRDVFGNPFRIASIPTDWLATSGGTVVKLAQAAYEERGMPSGLLDNSRLAVLANALEQAGCTDANIIAHCRKPEPHVRGCWAVDLILKRG